METIKELKPINQKSFNKNAYMITNGNITQLKSYNTIVSEYNHTTNKIKVFGYYSKTTAKHINAFLDYFGFDTANKKTIENWDNSDEVNV